VRPTILCLPLSLHGSCCEHTSYTFLNHTAGITFETGHDSDGFELITDSSHTELAGSKPGFNSSTAVTSSVSDASRTAPAAALNLNDFTSPYKVNPAATQTPQLPGRQSSSALSNYTANNSSNSILAQYLATRQYGRGALGMVSLLVTAVGQGCAELYWRVYFCSYGRRPRGGAAQGWGSGGGAGQPGLSQRRSRKQVAHTV
jgi:hypothetical protein